ncbi:MAG: glutathione S-transferase [Candidatus Eiseniibacteriota bacterium]
MKYEFYYWPMIQGRGEFVRLALEEAGADYVDVARRGDRGMQALFKMMEGGRSERVPLAPPFLKAGKLVIAQTANILMYLGAKHGLVPANEAGRLWANQLQLTVADFVDETHNTHHPIASSLYYEDQKREAKSYSEYFLKLRVPKFLGYFEDVLARNKRGDKWLIGARLSYPDLSVFQVIAGLRYAFPAGMKRVERKFPRLGALHDRVAERPNIAAYLASDRRIPFNEMGVYRRYPELDAKAGR